MPARRTRASAAAAQPVAAASSSSSSSDLSEPEESPPPPEADAQPPLQFNKPLSWRAGKPIPVAELHKRLQKLAQELREFDQDEVNVKSLEPVAGELASHNLLRHKDHGVQALTACCLVEILRLCAPNAPFTASQLKEVFTLFIYHILPALSDPASPYNSQHLAVLRSLAEVKSIVLLTDIPSFPTLAAYLFLKCFEVLAGPIKSDSGEQLSKNVEHHMTAVLTTLVEEAETVPDDVVEVIVRQFLRADPKTVGKTTLKNRRKEGPVDVTQGTLVLKEAPPAYQMAKNICNQCPEKMARAVTRYFGTVMTEAAEALTTSASEGRSTAGRIPWGTDVDEGLSKRLADDGDLEEFRKAHALLRELWRSAAGVLQDLIPTIEGELSSEVLELRLTAVETIGDMMSGIGAAGPPPNPVLNPAAYPSQSLSSSFDKPQAYDFLTTPSSPVSFSSRYYSTYLAFLNRRNDKSPIVRAAWTMAVGRVIQSSAGGVGLDNEEELKLLGYFSDCLVDVDERVRHNAIKAIETFSFNDIVTKLGRLGGVSNPNSLLNNLADRAKDKRHIVRTEGIRLLGRIYGVAAGAIAEGSETIKELFSLVPSRILDALYINDPDINKIVERVLYESIIPLSYPPLKSRSHATNGASQKGKENQANDQEIDVDKVRVERILILIRDMEQKARQAFMALQMRQTANAKYLSTILDLCEQYNGGVGVGESDDVKGQLKKLITYCSNTLPDATKAADDLWKFAKMHDRRSYQLIRFCMAADSDFRKVFKAMKELWKRIDEAGSHSLLDTLQTIVFRSSRIIYNRSHVPSIILFSRTNEKDLGATAHEVIKEISKWSSEIFKTHIQDLCKSLESDAPTVTNSHRPGAEDDLKACAEFAQKFPDDIPQDRRFFEALMNFVKFGEPRACKYAALILLTAAAKKEMYARNIFKFCAEGFEYGKGKFLTKLAALSQLMVHGTTLLNTEDVDTVTDIAINQVLSNEASSPKCSEAEEEWAETPDTNLQAKMWALKLLVNRVRALDETADVGKDAAPVFKVLVQLIIRDGHLGRHRTHQTHAPRQRLLAGLLLLKLSRDRRFNQLVTHHAFNRLALLAQDPLADVRSSFVKKLMKYLGKGQLPNRYYAPLFLLAFEPVDEIKNSVQTWLRSRARQFRRENDTRLEGCLARLVSLLAHHPDWEFDAARPNMEEGQSSLLEFSNYIFFYLRTVAAQENISLIFHIAQRVKSVADGLDEAKSRNLYALSDLTQAIIRQWDEVSGWNMQTWPGKVSLPAGIFKAMETAEMSREIASKMFVPEDVTEALDVLVLRELRKGSKKRKHESLSGMSKKRTKFSTASVSPQKPSSGAAAAKTKKVKASSAAKKRSEKKKRPRKSSDSIPQGERRRSARTSGLSKSYKEESGDSVEEEWDEQNTDESTDDDDASSVPDEEGVQDEMETESMAGAEKDVEMEDDDDGAEEAKEEPKNKRLSEASAEKRNTKSKPKSPTKTRGTRRTRGRAAEESEEDDER